jgi:hypothetical protein
MLVSTPSASTRSRSPPIFSLARRALFLLALPAATAAAQADSGWHTTVEANASLLFGAVRQTLTASALSLAHDDDRFAASAFIRFRYGESEDDARNTFVSSRGWLLSGTGDFLPKSRVSPFFFVTSEASLEKRIDNRSSGGAGAKWTFAKSATGSASVSLALLGERTKALSDSAIPIARLVRWSWRAKTEQRVGEKLTLSHVTFYAPQADAPSNYTITSTSSGAYALNAKMALTITFNDNYDSKARSRGALSNNDGALLFGLRSTF